MDRRQLREILITDTVIGFIGPAVSLRVNASPLMPHIVAGQVYSHCIGTLAYISLMWAYPRFEHWASFPRWLMVLLVLAVDATVGCAAAAAILAILGYFSFDDLWRQFLFSYRVSLVITFIFGVTGLITDTLKGKLESATRQREKALQLATEARLASLEARMNRHFLFNTLNSISSLVREDPDRAERLIERMAALMRYTLDASQLGFVTLAQEIDIVRGYLEIENARFGERLRCFIDMDPKTANQKIPPLSIQTLVENSVKYAIAPRREGGAIGVRSCCVGDALEIRIWDEGPGVDLHNNPPGHGLDLLQSRIQVLYEGAASLRSENSTVILTVPCSAPTLSTTKS